MGFLARNTMEKYCKRFRSGIEAAVVADDNFIEKNVFSVRSSANQFLLE